MNEIGRRIDSNEIVVRVDQQYFRPTEVDSLLGDSTKAKNKLGWEPSITLENLVSEMIENDQEIVSKKALLKENGFTMNISNIVS